MTTAGVGEIIMTVKSEAGRVIVRSMPCPMFSDNASPLRLALVRDTIFCFVLRAMLLFSFYISFHLFSNKRLRYYIVSV